MMTKDRFIEEYWMLKDGLYRVAYHLLESSTEAEDAVQELYAKLWASMDSLDQVHNPKAYCITLLRNDCISRIRRNSHTKISSLTEQMMQVADDIGSDGKETLSRVLKAIEELPDTQRRLLKMKVLEDMSYDEMAQKTGMNKLTLRVLVSRARTQLKNKI